jgi:prephenate dehydrogenase
MSPTNELIKGITTDIDARVSSLHTKLIACSSAEHDRIAGRIQGLAEAKTCIGEFAKRWRLADND